MLLLVSHIYERLTIVYVKNFLNLSFVYRKLALPRDVELVGKEWGLKFLASEFVC